MQTYIQQASNIAPGLTLDSTLPGHIMIHTRTARSIDSLIYIHLQFGGSYGRADNAAKSLEIQPRLKDIDGKNTAKNLQELKLQNCTAQLYLPASSDTRQCFASNMCFWLNALSDPHSLALRWVGFGGYIRETSRCETPQR